jgi:PAS domain S-box-containing protein
MDKKIINNTNKDIEKQISLLLKLSNTISDLIVIKDKNKRYIGFNTAFEEFIRIPKDQLLGKTNFDCFSPEIAEKLDKNDIIVLKTGKPINNEIWITNPQNEKILMDVHKAPISDENGKTYGVLSISRDITARNQVEQSLLLKDKLLSAVAEATNELVKNLDFNEAIVNAFDKLGSAIDVSRIVFFETKFDNQKNHEYFCYKHEWVSDPIYIQIDHPVLKHIIADDNPFGMSTKQKPPIIHYFKGSQGKIKKRLEGHQLKSVILFPINIDDKTMGYVGFDECKTERIWTEAEKAVLLSFAASLSGVMERNLKREKEKENEVKLQFTLDSMVDAHITTDSFGIIQSFNPAAEKIFRYEKDVFTGMSADDLFLQKFFNPNTDENVENKKFNYSDDKFELSGINKSGKIIPLKVSISEIYYGDQISFSFVISDISKEKEIERTKNEFISIVSHELRTPLTSIRGSLGLISSGAMGPISESIMELLDIANNNSLRLIQLINDILDIEKIEAGKMKFVFKTHEIMPIIEQSIEANKLYAQQYNVKLQLENALPDIKINVDKDRLIQVITNLLSNASKFSPPNCTVKISVILINNTVRICIKDCGAGIPEEFQDTIFQKFAQADSSDSRQKGGTGLGLSICKAIVEKLGGNIGFETQKNIGTTFYIDLPICQDISNQLVCPISHRPSILICEDDKDAAAYISLLLEQSHYFTEIAYNADQAKKLLINNNYDAAIVDIIMPEQDGISLIRELREKGNTIPIIVVSMRADEASKEQEGNFAVIDWINKPIDQERLLSSINRAIKIKCDSRPSILHIEDDIDVQNIVSSMLQSLAYVSSVRNISSAKMLLKEKHFDLVIIDIGLPDGNGLDLLPLISKNNDKSIATMIFSAQDVDENIAKKVDAVLLKSKTSNIEFINLIKNLIKNHV